MEINKLIVYMVTLLILFKSIAYSESSDAELVKLQKETMEKLESLAEQGEVASQIKVASMYLNGRGVKQDYTKALNWYRKAAEQGNSSAQNSLGLLCEKGIGIQRDGNKAVEWYLKSAEQGDIAAQYNLGMIYGQGGGIPKNNIQSFL